MNKKLVLLGATLLLTAAGASAQKRVTGRVVDAQGEPVVGATVRVEGHKVVVTTDDNGRFTLNSVPSSAKHLLVTYIGKESQSVSIAGNVNVVMKEAENSFDEAIVVAYGTAKKSAFTGSASQIKGEKIEQRVTANVTNALSGQMAGVQTFTSSGKPGSGSTIRIRGIGSISSSNSPLIIVDGMPYDGALSSINPMDIESISAQKDAAANAIYGARGANGVIMVTTKQGRDRDAVVTVDAKWGSNHRATPNYKRLGVQNYYETAYRALYNSKALHGATPAEAYAYADANIFKAQNGGVGYQVYTVPDGERFIGTNFKINPNATLGYNDGQYYYTPDDWYDEFFGDGNLRQEYNVNIAGRSERMSYYTSVNYLNDNGLIANSGFRRYSGRGRIEYQAKKWLRVGSNMDFSETQSRGDMSADYNSSGNLFSVANLMGPIYPLYVRDTNGNIVHHSVTGNRIYDNGSSTTNMKRPFFGPADPGGDNENNRSLAVSNTFNGKWFAEITPIEGLRLTANISVTDVNTRTNRLYSVFGSNHTTSDGQAYVSHSHTTGVNTQYLANYKRTFADIHNVDVLVGYENYKLRMQGLSGSNDHLFNPFIGELDNAHGKDKKSVSSSTDRYMTEGILSRLQYDYAGKYFVSASYRRDASSVFHKDNRWGNFGSVGAAWLITKEDFMDDYSSWLDALKLKASWGVQGNDAILDADGYRVYYAYTDRYAVSYSDETNEYSKTLSYKGNKKLTWEKSKAFNIGIDFELFKGRLSGTFEYFNRKTSDLLYNKPTPMSAGILTGSMPVNVGSMVNRGVELELTGYIFKRNDFDWSVNFNLTHYKNKILSLDPAAEANGGLKYSNVIRRVGGSMYQVYLKEYAGVDPETGLSLYWKDVTTTVTDAEGNTSTVVTGRELTTDYDKATQYDLGDPLPKVYGGLGTSLRWKGLDFSLQLAYQLGGKIYDGTYQAMMHSGQQASAGTAWHKDILKAWTPENRYTDVPRVDASDATNQNLSSRWLTSSDYLSFNNVTLGYTLPADLTKRFSIASLRFYVSGDNLGVISARKGFDPRSRVAGGSWSSQSTANYSQMRNITGGVTLTF